MRYFVYGTLLDDDMRRAVLAGGARRLTVRPAILAGFRRVTAPGRDYPMLLEDPVGSVVGAVLEGVTAAMARRLAAYEGFEYRLDTCRVTTDEGLVAARVFLARQRPSSGRAWSLARWRRNGKKAMLARL